MTDLWTVGIWCILCLFSFLTMMLAVGEERPVLWIMIAFVCVCISSYVPICVAVNGNAYYCGF